MVINRCRACQTEVFTACLWCATCLEARFEAARLKPSEPRTAEQVAAATARDHGRIPGRYYKRKEVA